MFEAFTMNPVVERGAGWISAAVVAYVLPAFVAADGSVPEKVGLGGALLVGGGFIFRAVSKYFETKKDVIEAQSNDYQIRAQTAEEQNAAFIERMVAQQTREVEGIQATHGREVSALEKSITRLEKFVAGAEARADKADARADAAEKISASASKGRHEALGQLQSAETWIKDAMEVMKRAGLPETYVYHFTDWKNFFTEHDKKTAELLENRTA